MKKIIFIILFISNIYSQTNSDFFTEMSNLYNSQNFELLEEKCQTKLNQDNHSLEALFFIASKYFYLNDYDKATPFMLRFEKIHNEQDSLMNLEEKNDIINIDSRFTGLYYHLGEYYVYIENYKRAVDWLERSKAVYFKDPMLNFYLGLSYMEIEDYKNSIKYFLRQLEYDPEEPSPFYNIACVYSLQSNIKDAVIWLEKAIKKYPKYKEESKKDSDFDNIRSSKEYLELINN